MRTVHKGTYFERFNQKYKVVESGCWEWQFGLTSTGYGKFNLFGKSEIASRASYLFFIGDLSGRLDFVCHTCDNPKCVSPFHLFLGTPSDNTQDAIKKGRWRKPDPHPSVAYYKHHGCKCDDCKRLYSEFTKLDRIKNKYRIKEQKRLWGLNNKDSIRRSNQKQAEKIKLKKAS